VLLGDVETGLATIRRGQEIASELGDAPEVAGALTWLAYSLREAGRHPEAVAAGLEAATYASRHGLGARWATNALESMSWALIDVGRWDEATEALFRAQQYELSRVKELEGEGMLLLLEALQGEFDAANRRAPRVSLLAARHTTGTAPAALAELALWQDDPLAARAALVRIDDHPGIAARYMGGAFAAGIRAEADLAALARSRHDDAGLAESHARGRALLARMTAAFEDATAHVPISKPRVAALLADCEAEFSRLEATPDPDRWALAAASWRTLEVSYGQGYALMREAEATLALHRDRPRAARALNEAWAIATRLRAAPLREATEALAARAGITLEPADGRIGPDDGDAGIRETKGSKSTKTAGRAGAVPRGRYDLTPREREVLALVAAGRSDGEIAEALFISKKTASFHVAMIKGKLGAGSRVEIATDAIGLGLIEAPTSPRT
jgi:DNA-binding CsgD family transcriptional regulator